MFLWYFRNKHSHRCPGIWTSCPRAFLATLSMIWSMRCEFPRSQLKILLFFFCIYSFQKCWLEEKYAFINHARHHKHAWYILQCSEVPLYIELSFFQRFCKRRHLHVLQNVFFISEWYQIHWCVKTVTQPLRKQMLKL